MKVYIDEEFKCHCEDGKGRTAVESDFFDDLCPEFIEGCCYVPAGEMTLSEDGTIIRGETIFPWKPFNEIYQAQLRYQMADMRAALGLLGVNADG